MSAIQDIFREYGPQYLARYGDQMPKRHKKTMRDIIDCRSGAFGALVYGCDCGAVRSIACCCGNRHCPTCQQEKADRWLHKQVEKLLPTHYFLVTITLPQELRRVVRSHQKIAYAALFSAAREALKTLARDKRFIGSAHIGYLAVLHTWGNQLQYHPHLHLVIPGGALSEEKDQWIPSRRDLFVHTKPLAVLVRAKFRAAMKKARLYDRIDPAVWKRQWVADSQAVGQGQHSMGYLARYVFRVAISNHRIVSAENGVIRFRYKDRRGNKWKTMTLDAMEFIRRFLQHVLPKGFMKVRHYGFLNPNSALSIEKIRALISSIQEAVLELLPDRQVYKPRGFQCPCCKQPLRFVAFVKPLSRWGPACG